MKPLKTEDVLRYSLTPKPRSTVRRKYASWRAQQGIPVRCDVKECRFYTEPLVWLDKSLPVVLDHISGNKGDDSPKNLRYICPNCDSQLLTRGGANRGRVQEATESTFVLMERDGRRNYHLIPEPARLQLTGHAATLVVTPAKGRK